MSWTPAYIYVLYNAYVAAYARDTRPHNVSAHEFVVGGGCANYYKYTILCVCVRVLCTKRARPASNIDTYIPVAVISTETLPAKRRMLLYYYYNM